MAVSIPLPHSGLSPYKGNYWRILEKDMKLLMKEATLSRMEEVILKYISRKHDSSAMVYNNLRRIFSNDFTMSLVPYLAHLVTQLPVLFPDKSLVMLRRGEPMRVSLTRSQVCLHYVYIRG